MTIHLPSLYDALNVFLGLAVAAETKYVVEYVVVFAVSSTASNTAPDVSSVNTSKIKDSSDQSSDVPSVPSSELLVLLVIL